MPHSSKKQRDDGSPAPTINRYGRMAAEWLKSTNRAEFDRLVKNGSLKGFQLRKQAELEQQIEEVRTHLEERHPEDTQDFLVRVERLENAQRQAEEIAIANVFPIG